ncbi:hypothetical protein Q6346_11560 [Isoptericola sp. b490]|uniref:hypothetical protein n=1 Tax=Actinotalea lenta TaxID=3064654 RepID=UPI002712B517|nr:hypothetical protein [Isoptericola sp. b490]MDO8121947.1 hypothetical protein [Isoptericola sp. b490]
MDAPRTSRRRVGMIVALSWLGAAVLTGTVAWRAVAVLDSGTQRTGVLSEAEVHAALVSARTTAGVAAPSPTPGVGEPTKPGTPTASTPPAASGTPSSAPPSASPSVPPASAPPATRPSTQPPPPAEVTRTWNVTGGTVVAACQGVSIRLVGATPWDGWTVEARSAGPQTVDVELHREGHDTVVVARCVDGVPSPQVSGDSDGEQDD